MADHNIYAPDACVTTSRDALTEACPINFIFDGKFERAAVTLSSWPGYIHPAMRDRIKQTLATGCYCIHDSERTATLVQRNGAVWIQCDACGGSVGTAMKRAEHSAAATYPMWRPELVERYDGARAKYLERLPSMEEKARAREREYVERSIAYERWCRTSPEWAEIKKRIAWRSRGHCEACLSAPATVVHHTTYAFGKLPPAWHLKAVCDDCHNRLHWRPDDWCDYGMARGQE